MSGPPSSDEPEPVNADTAPPDTPISQPAGRPAITARLSESLRALVTDRAMLAVVVTLIAALVMLTMRLLAIRTTSTAPRFTTGDWLLADLGTNLPLAVFAGLGLVVVGGLAAADGHRWGDGLVFGAATSLIGIGTLILGLAERPVQAVRLSANLPSAQSYTTTITRPIGWTATVVMVIAATVVAVLVLRRLDRRADESFDRRGAWVAIALMVLAAAGTAIPMASASILDNLETSPGFPMAFVLGRFVQVAVLVAAVVIGLRARNTAGIGIVAGALVIPTWLVISAVFGFGGSPVSLGGRNPGMLADATPTTVTVVGLFGLVAMAVTLVMVARDRTARRFLDAVSDARA